MIRFNTPDEVYAELFEEVQSRHVFADSKMFVDATPKSLPARILDDFRDEAKKGGFDLKSFVVRHFDLPDESGAALDTDARRPIRQQIELLWDALTRAADKTDQHSSLIALPQPYVVPGGRFREIYYWDSYFTMLGLAASGRHELVESMVNNFAFLIDQIGFIPNGNRTYYCTRSQPPFFVLMVELLAEVKQDAGVYATYLPQLKREYDFWMAGWENLANEPDAFRRVVAARGGYLNRHWDDSDLPRQESYAEDAALSAMADREPNELYRDIRAACESGWDFSSRWLRDHRSMVSIATRDVVPVDLNALMWKLEDVLALTFSRTGESKLSSFFRARADQRKHLIQSLFFDEGVGIFVDLSVAGLMPTGTPSLATAFPLFFDLATAEQSKRVVENLQQDFLRPGGWVTTLNNTGHQWDAPNGWAPLQWVVYTGMRNVGYSDQATEGARRWVDNNLLVYREQGRLMEKYNVEDVGYIAEGGEYSIQDGFGWTNGVLLRLMDDLEFD